MMEHGGLSHRAARAAALKIAARITDDLEEQKPDLNLEMVLYRIATEQQGFGDVVDDNLYIHDELKNRGWVSGDVAVCVHSKIDTARWNLTVSYLDWAAAAVLRERVDRLWIEISSTMGGGPMPAITWGYYQCFVCHLPMHSGVAERYDGKYYCQGCAQFEKECGR